MKWKPPLALLLGILLLGGIVTAAPVDKPEAVPLATVKALAVRELHKFPEFNGAVPTNPTPLYFPDGRLAAYEFRMVKNEKTIGYIIVSANRNLPPAILEAGFGEKTPSDLMKELATRKGVKTYRFAYFSGLNYGLLAGDKVVDMKGKEYKKPEKYELPPEAKVNKNQDEWRSTESTLFTITKTGYPIIPLATITSEKIIYDVPAWTETDLGNGSWQYPSNVGPTIDPWAKWDGCAPIAGSMVIGYYESQYRTDWYREALIDILHKTMGTSDSGSTDDRDDVVRGMENFYWEASELYHLGVIQNHPIYGYDAEGTSGSFNWLFSVIKSEVDNNKPGLLGTVEGIFCPIIGSQECIKTTGGHVTTFVGYRTYSDGKKYIYVHTTWKDDPKAWILFDVGNMVSAWVVTITPIQMCDSGEECPTPQSVPEVP
ncbi:cysteine peptidase family C39 domain-containing protein [Thermococcus aciditolerans]|uniref:Peptidase C39-like domain-containing protein n=1 Tax=Thermococcus aciditolerans TaxID=2598455 RepID=A0A5C0SNY7_9EURY|nr:hypothetical protein [Thermococcus aciditolerans]QEK15497.1 hypothetical protein FPV09_10850 [Thermococcus aciditolerans]